MTPRPADVVFDLDGTLSDPIEGIHLSLNHALQYHGDEPVSRDRIAEFIGPPLDQMLRVLTGTTESNEVPSLVAKYREQYSHKGYAENVLYPGVEGALEVLQGAGVAMAVCTSKRADYATRILEMFEIRDFFAFIDGGKIGAEKWKQLARHRNRGAVDERTVMIGDRSVDMSAAHRNGLPAGGVLWGYGSREELATEKPEYFFEEPDQWSVFSSKRTSAGPTSRGTDR